MSDLITWYFIKFFENEQYADEFLQGTLFMNRLSHFKKHETETLDGRPDKNEAISMWLQPEGINITLTAPTGEKIDMGVITSPISSSSSYHGNAHIFCMYTVETTGFLPKDGKIKLSPAEFLQFKHQIRIDERCVNFGPYAVVIKATPFIPILHNALINCGNAFSGKRVEYYDGTTFNGTFEPEDIPFRKQHQFSFQKEFRICIYTQTTGSDPLKIEVGDISAICIKMDSAKLNDMFESELKYLLEEDDSLTT